MKCDHEFTSIEDKSAILIKCPRCGWWAIRNEVPSKFSIRYKEKGFYDTDYKEDD